jgi:hypothetical protein
MAVRIYKLGHHLATMLLPYAVHMTHGLPETSPKGRNGLLQWQAGPPIPVHHDSPTAHKHHQWGHTGQRGATGVCPTGDPTGADRPNALLLAQHDVPLAVSVHGHMRHAAAHGHMQHAAAHGHPPAATSRHVMAYVA